LAPCASSYIHPPRPGPSQPTTGFPSRSLGSLPFVLLVTCPFGLNSILFLSPRSPGRPNVSILQFRRIEIGSVAEHAIQNHYVLFYTFTLFARLEHRPTTTYSNCDFARHICSMPASQPGPVSLKPDNISIHQHRSTSDNVLAATPNP
jgi:hypothetical protein